MVSLYSIEGNTQKLDGGAMFGNAPKALWQRWLKPDEENRIPLSCRALLARDLNGMTVLFETGIGAFFEPKLKERYGVVEDEHVLLKSLEARGLSHEDIDVVVLSHLHFDHAGGLLAPWEEGQAHELLFPNATFIVGERHWQRAKNPHYRDKASFIPELNSLLESSGRLELISGRESATLGDAVRFHYSEGHTPGLMLAEIGAAEGGGIVFCGDLIPGRPWVHLPITMGYDRAAEQLIDEKQMFLVDKMIRKVRLYFTHDSEICSGLPMKDERGKFTVQDEMPTLDGLEL